MENGITFIDKPTVTEAIDEIALPSSMSHDQSMVGYCHMASHW